MNKLHQKGFAPLVVIVIVIAVLAIGGYFVVKSRVAVAPTQSPTVTSKGTAEQNSGTCNSTSPSTIKVLSPNGLEVYQAGQKITVKWKSCNVTPNSIGIILIKHNQSIPYTQSERQGDYAGFSLGSYSTVDDGTEQITLPASSDTNLISGKYYFISITGLGDATHIGSGYTPGDYSDSLFTVNNRIK